MESAIPEEEEGVDWTLGGVLEVEPCLSRTRLNTLLAFLNSDLISIKTQGDFRTMAKKNERKGGDITFDDFSFILSHLLQFVPQFILEIRIRSRCLRG